MCSTNSTGINKSRLEKYFRELVMIPSPSFHEDAVFAYAGRVLEALGFEQELLSYGEGANLYASLPATGEAMPPLLLCAHADTVEPCRKIGLEEDDERFYTDGSSVLGGDNKTAIAEILEVLTLIRENRLPHGRLEVFISSGEEVALAGARHLQPEKFRAKQAVLLDASGDPGTAVIAAPAYIKFAIECRGKKAHSGIEPEKGINALHAAAVLITRFPTGRIDSESVANFGTITGGDAANIVPAQVTIIGEIRSHNAQRLEELFRELESRAVATARETGASIEVKVQSRYPAYQLEDSHPLLRAFEASCEACHIPFATHVAGGCSDANVISKNGIDCINLASGMRKVHTTEEYVLKKDLYNTARLLFNLLTEQSDKLSGQEHI